MRPLHLSSFVVDEALDALSNASSLTEAQSARLKSMYRLHATRIHSSELADVLSDIDRFPPKLRNKFGHMYSETETSTKHATPKDFAEFFNAFQCMTGLLGTETVQFNTSIPESSFDFLEDPEFLAKVEQHWVKIRRDKGFMDVGINKLPASRESDAEEDEIDVDV